MDDSINKSNLEPISDKRPQEISPYAKLNKGLLYLLTGELLYYFVIIIFEALAFIFSGFSGGRTSEFRSFFNSLFPWAFIPVFIGYAGNIFGGVASFIMAIKMKKVDLQGIGQLLNLLFIISSWFVFIAIFYNTFDG